MIQKLLLETYLLPFPLLIGLGVVFVLAYLLIVCTKFFWYYVDEKSQITAEELVGKFFLWTLKPIGYHNKHTLNTSDRWIFAIVGTFIVAVVAGVVIFCWPVFIVVATVTMVARGSRVMRRVQKQTAKLMKHLHKKETGEVQLPEED